MSISVHFNMVSNDWEVWIVDTVIRRYRCSAHAYGLANELRKTIELLEATKQKGCNIVI